MAEIGYHLSSEEHGPNDLVRYARRAEEVGFTFALVADHFHPWIDRQGQSAFVWSVIGAIAHATERLRLGTGVTCPTMRIHPAIIAHAAATAATMMPGRFFLGVGTGEHLNEHVLGQPWPTGPERLEMLEEAVQVIRELWKGDTTDHRGRYYTVEDARLYTRPDTPPPIVVAASGERALALAARIGDGLISTTPGRDAVERFVREGGGGKPRYGQFKVCWAASETEARRIVHTYWPTGALPDPLGTELRTPREFEAAASLVTEEQAAEGTPLGPDPEPHIRKIREYLDAGYDHVYIHQVGPDQEGFFRFYEREVLPHVQREAARR